MTPPPPSDFIQKFILFGDDNCPLFGFRLGSNHSIFVVMEGEINSCKKDCHFFIKSFPIIFVVIITSCKFFFDCCQICVFSSTGIFELCDKYPLIVAIIARWRDIWGEPMLSQGSGQGGVGGWWLNLRRIPPDPPKLPPDKSPALRSPGFGPNLICGGVHFQPSSWSTRKNL